MDKVAVLLPIYAGDKLKYIINSVESVKNQTYTNIDLVVLIDGPINSTVCEYLEKLEGISILRFKENRGLPFVLNDGIKYCNKKEIKYIARMDADDIALTTRIEKQITFLQNNPDIDVVGGAISEIDEVGRSRNKIVVYPHRHEDCLDFYKKRDPLAHPTVIFRNTFFKKAGLYSELHKKNQDTILWYNGFINGAKFSNIPDIVLYFRITNEFFKSRRNGFSRAVSMLKDRFIINKGLKFGYIAYVYSIYAFILTLLPPIFKKIAYRIFR